MLLRGPPTRKTAALKNINSKKFFSKKYTLEKIGDLLFMSLKNFARVFHLLEKIRVKNSPIEKISQGKIMCLNFFAWVLYLLKKFGYKNLSIQKSLGLFFTNKKATFT